MRVEEPGGPDAVSLDPDRPVYQVNIFTRLTEPGDRPETERGFRVSEWKVYDADVTAVLDWAAGKANGREYTVAVAAAVSDDTAHHLRLFGVNPTTTYFDPDDPYEYSPDRDSSGSVVIDHPWFS